MFRPTRSAWFVSAGFLGTATLYCAAYLSYVYIRPFSVFILFAVWSVLACALTGMWWFLMRIPTRTESWTIDHWPESFRNPKWDIVSKRDFVNEVVDMDGKSFRDCSFTNIQLMYHGNAPTEIVGTSAIEGSVIIVSDNPAINLFTKLYQFLTSAPNAEIREQDGTQYKRKPLLAPDPLKESEALASLPVHLCDIRVDTLEICEGLRFRGNYVFLNLKIASVGSIGIFNSEIRVKTNSGNTYRGKRIPKLTEWILVEHFIDQKFHSPNTRDIPLDTVELSTYRLHASLPEKGWIGFEISDVDIWGADIKFYENIRDIRIEFEEMGKGIHKIDLPSRPSWPTTENKIVHSELRVHT
jgi:hypothetical protein